MATFLLIHGACHGGWCWGLLTPLLTEAGHTVIAPDLPCDDLDAGWDEYAEVAEQALGEDTPELVVVGHSLGALTASVVAARRPTVGLCLVAGIIGAPRSSLQDLVTVDHDRDVPFEPTDFETDAEGRFCFTPEGARRVLFHDCEPTVTEDAIRRLRFQRSLFTEALPIDGWPHTEITSILCRDDRVVNPAWSRRRSPERLGAQVVELDGGHSPMLSRPAELAAALTANLP